MITEFWLDDTNVYCNSNYGNIYISTFGYELNNINKDPDRQTEVIVRRALDWHKQLFNAVCNNPVKSGIVCKIKRNDNLGSANNNLLRIAILIYVVSDDEATLKEKTKLLSDELSLLFKTDNHASASPYLFGPIDRSEQLNDWVEFNGQEQIFDYLRKPVYYKRPIQSIGYKSHLNEPETISFVPQFFLPDIFSLGNVAAGLLHARLPVHLSVYLIPVKLSIKDLKEFKRISRKYQLIDEHFTKHEKETYFKHLELLFDDNTNHFLFHVQLFAPKNSLLGHSLHNSIADSFFGNLLNVEISSGDSEKFFQLLTQEKKTALIPFLYPYEIIQSCFRLPVASGDDISWFPNQTNIYNYFPPDIPKEGILMGEKKFLNQKKEVRISEHDLSRHAYIMGQTGVGKTTLLKTMILDHINKGHGVGVVDPHGDLISSIYDKIPFERIRDVIYFDPVKNQEIKINILEYSQQHPEQRTFIFNELIKILDELYDLQQTGGPMFEQYFKNVLFLIMEARGNLYDFHKFFFDSDFRDAILDGSKLNDSVLFLRNALERKGEVSFDNISSYITSKVNRFVQDDFIAPLIKVKKSSINFRDIIDTGKILLVKLPKGRLGSDGVKFLGTLLFNRIIMAALTRENTTSDKRRPFYLYIDEFQNFTSGDIETALSESRKYGLSLIMANQTLSQLKTNIQETLLSNVGSQVFFRPGANIINRLRPYFQGYITEQEFVYLSNFHAFARLMSNNKPLKPFIFETIHTAGSQ